MDYVVHDKYLDQNLQFFNPIEVPVRKCHDPTTDYNGMKLLDLCLSTGLLIGNGRLCDDQNVGKFTFCSHIGQSVADYLLLNFCYLNTISYFDVLKFDEHSYHVPITLHFSLKSHYSKLEASSNDFFISRNIVWDDKKISLFHSQLMNE